MDIKKIMKKLSLLALIIFSGNILSAQSSVVVTAEAFKANPTQYVGKIVTIQNVKLISNKPPTSTVGGPNIPPGKVLNTNTTGGTSRPSSTTSSGGTTNASSLDINGNAFCNEVPNFSLTKWSLGPNNEICVQVSSTVKPQLDQVAVGATVKSLTFRCNETVYSATKIEK